MPVPDYLMAGSDLDVPEDMRMPALELLYQTVDHVLNIELLLFGGDLGVEHHLKEHIPEFLFHMMGVAPTRGSDKFSGLFS